ncbi:glycosyl hydrolase family 20, catalytic domain protein [Ancylostoma ceylanicum]|uniref:beta-N-acetylhexosaminidase n=1 Tax=Ancylostoma ceylanicum TaxID=53326 RepID=A0A0D6L6C8_9BILA|nr:glycosyl hydrolase family 20, catalytic domain protein [Ancylostoma ceylanicum]
MLQGEGGIWPLPWTINYDSYNHTINPGQFHFTSKVGTCDIIDKAMARYQKLSFPLYDAVNNLVVDRSKGIATLTANEVWGALRGLETFSQLIYQPKKNQDLMAQNKMNVLHWHLVDSESFPYTSVKFPNMSTLGAYTPSHVYSVADMKKVMDYARLRGIRVVPEFDTPGHAGAWGKSFTHLLPTCYNAQGFISELSNIMDPTLESTFTFLSSFFTEALALFKDNYMHFGGDEVSYDMQQCWANNPEVTKRMKQLGYSSTSQLLNYYWNRLFSIIDKARAGTKKVVWQEVLDMNVPANTSIAHVWKGGNIDDIMNEMAKVTANEHRAILSSCWYLNYIKYGADWGYIDNSNMRLRGLYYECDPTNFQGTAAQKSHEVSDREIPLRNKISRSTTPLLADTSLLDWFALKPRASAVAERLWSDPSATFSADAAWPRLHEFRCRMMNRGFPTEPPNNPDYCPFEWNPNYTEL